MVSDFAFLTLVGREASRLHWANFFCSQRWSYQLASWCSRSKCLCWVVWFNQCWDGSRVHTGFTSLQLPSSSLGLKKPLGWQEKLKQVQLPTMQHWESPWPWWLRTVINIKWDTFDYTCFKICTVYAYINLSINVIKPQLDFFPSFLPRRKPKFVEIGITFGTFFPPSLLQFWLRGFQQSCCNRFSL